MNNKKKITSTLSFVILLSFLLSVFSGCGPKTSDQSSGDSSTKYASVNINIKRQVEKVAGGTSVVATLPPVKAVRILVSAGDIDNINKVIEIPVGQTSAELDVDVPVGPNRFFEVFLIGLNNKNVLYGNAYSDITSGDSPSINIFVYQVGGDPLSLVITDPFNGNSVFTGQQSHTFVGTCDSTFIDIWINYFSTNVPSLDTTFSLASFPNGSYLSGDTTWSYDYDLAAGFNQFNLFGIAADSTYGPPDQQALYFDSSILLPAPVITTPATGTYTTTTPSIAISGTTDSETGIFVVSYLSDYDSSLDLTYNLPGYVASNTTWSLTHALTSGFNRFLFYAYHPSGQLAFPAILDVTYTPTGDTNAPTIINHNPAPIAVNIPLASTIYFEIDDVGSSVNPNTLNVLVNSVPAIANGVFQSGFSGLMVPDSAGGLNVTIVPLSLFSSNQTVSVVINVSDYAATPNAMPTETYSFTSLDAGGTQMLMVTKPGPGTFDTFDSTYLIEGLCSSDTNQIEVHHVSPATDTTFYLPAYIATDTTWSFMAPVDMGNNAYTFTGYDSNSIAGAYDTTSIRRTIVGTSYLDMCEPNLGNDFTTPVPTVYFFGDCSPDTFNIKVTRNSASLDTTMPVNNFIAYDSSWGHAAVTLEPGINHFHFAGYDSSNNVGAFDDITITLDSTYIAPPEITSPNSGLPISVSISPVTLLGSCDSTNTVAMFVETYLPDLSLDTTFQIVGYTSNSPTWAENIDLNLGENYIGVYAVAADSTESARDIMEVYFDSSVNSPIILNPNSGLDFSTNQMAWTVDGTCDPDVVSIYANGAPIAFTAFSGFWTFDTTLHEGPNNINVIAIDNSSNASTPTFMNIDVKPNPFWALGFDSSVELFWDNLTDPAWDGVAILRKLGDYPSSSPINGTSYSQGNFIGDGQVAYYGSADSTSIDPGLANHEYYYYKLYPYDIDAGYIYGNPIKRVAAPRSNLKIIANAATSDQQRPRIWGDQIVWEDSRNGDIDVYQYNLSTKTEKDLTYDTSNLWDQYEPVIWGDRVVYTENLDGFHDLYQYDCFYDSTSFLGTNYSYSDMTPEIYENNVVYISNFSAYDYLYKIDLSSQPFTSVEVVGDMAGSYNPTLWELSALYEKSSFSQDLYVSDISALSGEQAVVTSTNVQGSPDLWENLLVWHDNRDGYYDIWYRDLFDSTDVRLQNEPLSQLNPAVYGPMIVWEDYRDATNKAELYMTDIMDTTTSEMRLTFTTTRHKANPDIWGEKIVWAQDDGTLAPDWNIYLFDLEPTGEHEFPQPPHNILGWDIWGDKLVYADDRNGNPDIFLFDMTTKEEIPICINSFDQINPAIYENTVVWEDYREGTADIYYLNKNDFTNPNDSGQRVNTSAVGLQERPDVYERYVVWQDRRDNTQYDIYYYNLFDSTELPVEVNTSNEYDPRIYKNRIVWVDTRNGDQDIYGFDLAVGGASYAIVQDTTYDQRNPDVYENKYIYEEDRLAGSTQIVVFDTTATDLTFDTTSGHFAPRMFGNRAVWIENNGINDDIYLYDFSEGRTILLTGQDTDEINPVINQDKVLYLRMDSASGMGRLSVFDLY